MKHFTVDLYDNRNLDNHEIKISCNGFSLQGSVWQRSEGQKDQNQLTQQTVAVKASVQCWIIHHLPSTQVFSETYSYKTKAENDMGKDLRTRSFSGWRQFIFQGLSNMSATKRISLLALQGGHCNNKGTKWYRNNLIYYNIMQLPLQI